MSLQEPDAIDFESPTIPVASGYIDLAFGFPDDIKYSNQYADMFGDLFGGQGQPIEPILDPLSDETAFSRLKDSIERIVEPPILNGDENMSSPALLDPISILNNTIF